MLWRQPRWQSSFLVQNIKCPHSGWAGIRDQNWNVPSLGERGNRIRQFCPYYAGWVGKYQSKLFSTIVMQCVNLRNAMNNEHSWEWVSAQCLQHMGMIRLCRFDNKIPSGAAFKCSLHLPWDCWTSLKCPITSGLCQATARFQMRQSRFLQKQSTFREKLCH